MDPVAVADTTAEQSNPEEPTNRVSSDCKNDLSVAVSPTPVIVEVSQMAKTKKLGSATARPVCTYGPVTYAETKDIKPSQNRKLSSRIPVIGAKPHSVRQRSVALADTTAEQSNPEEPTNRVSSDCKNDLSAAVSPTPVIVEVSQMAKTKNLGSVTARPVCTYGPVTYAETRDIKPSQNRKLSSRIPVIGAKPHSVRQRPVAEADTTAEQSNPEEPTNRVSSDCKNDLSAAVSPTPVIVEVSQMAKTKKLGSATAKPVCTYGPVTYAETKDIKPSQNRKLSSRISVIGAKTHSVRQPALSVRSDGAAKVTTGKKTIPSTTAGSFSTSNANTKTVPLSPRSLQGTRLRSISCQNSKPFFLHTTHSQISTNSNRCSHRSAHERVTENNRIKIFEGHLQKLETVQTAFVQKLEAWKGTLPGKVNREFKFVGMVVNEECKLIVNADCLKKLPILPVHAVADVKDQMHDAVKGCFKVVQERIKNKGGLQVAHFLKILQQAQTHCLGLLFKQINHILSVTVASEQYMKNQERKASDLQTQCDMEIAKKDCIVADKIEALEKGIEKKLNWTERAVEQKERKRLVEKINYMKEDKLMLKKELHRKDILFKKSSRQLKEKNEEIAKLQKELERSRTKADAMEVTRLKVTNEKAILDFVALEEKLLATKKELKEIFDFKVERYPGQIKKLNQDLKKKNIELAACAVKYTDAESPLLELHSTMKCEMEKLKLQLTRLQSDSTQHDDDFKHLNLLLNISEEEAQAFKSTVKDQNKFIKRLVSEKNEADKQMSKLEKKVEKKSNDFLKIYATLGANQILLSKQEHIRKLLEEDKVRSRNKIARMELELGELKQKMLVNHNQQKRTQ